MAENEQVVADSDEVVGHAPVADKEKTIGVEVDGRDAIVQIGREKVRLDRQTIPALIQLLQRAFIEVS